MEITIAVSLAFIQMVLTIGVLLYEYKKRSGGVLLWAMLFAVFGFSHFTGLLSSYHHLKYPIWVYNNASLFVSFFNIVYLIMRITLNRGKKYCINIPEYIENTPQTKSFFILMITIMLVSVAVRVHELSKYSGGLLETSWGDMLNSGGGYFGVEIVFRILFYFSSTILFVAIIEKKKLWMAIISLVILFCVVITRNRADILPFLVSLLAYFIFYKKMTIKMLMQLSLVGVGAIILITAILLFRFYGSINNFVENADVNLLSDTIIEMVSDDESDLSVRDAFYVFILHDNNYEGFNHLHTYIRLFLFAIPTQWSFGLKPDDFAETMGHAYMPSEGAGYSMHPTLYGDCFANAYYMGVLLAIFWAFLVYLFDRFADSRRDEQKLCFIVMMGCAYVMIGRGSAYNPVVSIIYEMALLILTSYLSNLLLKNKWLGLRARETVKLQSKPKESLVK